MVPEEEQGPRLQIVDVTEEYHGKPKSVVVGIGGCGCNAIDRMLSADIMGVEYIAMNTDLQALQNCEPDLKVQLGPKLTGGLGTGGNVEVGESAAEETRDEIQESLQDSSMVFIAAGMGGGTGTGAAPVVARLAKEHNNANLIALGQRMVDPDLALDIVRAWLKAEFQQGRHQRRIDQLEDDASSFQ